jgi:hypothetical protein
MDQGSQRSDGRAREFSVPRPLPAAAPLLVAALAALALAATALVPPAAALAVAAACFILAAFRSALATRDRWLLRRQADGLLRTGVKVHPQSALLVWRAAELTSVRNRRVLSSSLKRLARELLRPSTVSAVPLNRRAVRPHLALLQELASRLAQVDRPVAPKGMVLVEELLTDGRTSPLYIAGCDSDVPAAALERCLSALDGDADANQGIVVQFPAQGRGGVTARSDHRNHAHSGGSR